MQRGLVFGVLRVRLKARLVVEVGDEREVVVRTVEQLVAENAERTHTLNAVAQRLDQCDRLRGLGVALLTSLPAELP